jgi:hypothetical protein
LQKLFRTRKSRTPQFRGFHGQCQEPWIGFSVPRRAATGRDTRGTGSARTHCTGPHARSCEAHDCFGDCALLLRFPGRSLHPLVHPTSSPVLFALRLRHRARHRGVRASADRQTRHLPFRIGERGAVAHQGDGRDARGRLRAPRVHLPLFHLSRLSPQRVRLRRFLRAGRLLPTPCSAPPRRRWR